MKRGLFKKILCGLLTAALILDYAPVKAAAVEDTGLCPHHSVHTEECGYAPGETGSPCNHQHTEECYREERSCIHVHGDCGYVPGIEGVECDCAAEENGQVVHQEGCGYVETVPEVPCGHVCSEESGCIQKVLDCAHTHDENCGYAEAKEEAPCGFVCAECEGDEKLDKEEKERLEKSEEDEAQAREYGISFDADGGTILDNCPDAYLSGDTVELPAKVVKLGYRFAGWCENDHIYTEISADSAGERNFTALWQEKQTASIRTSQQTFYYDGNGKTYSLMEENGNYLPSRQTGWLVPCSFLSIQRPFGMDGNGYHQGIDLETGCDWPVYAARSGVVTEAAYSPSAGYYVSLNHGDGYASIYMHLSSYDVTPGTSVKVGDVIGYTGRTGVADGYHLHFGISYNGSYVNPEAYVSFYDDGFYLSFAPESGLNTDGLPTEVGSYDMRILRRETETYRAVDLFVPSALVIKEANYGNIGAYGSWVLENGVLTISGLIKNYPPVDQLPWQKYRDQITELVVNSYPEISAGTFEGLEQLEKVTISGANRIGAYAFADCPRLKTIVFTESIPYQIDDTAFYRVCAEAHYTIGDYNSYVEERLKNYGGSLTWIEHGEAAKRIAFQSVDRVPLEVGEDCALRIMAYPYGATADCAFSLDQEGIVVLSQLSFRGCMVRAIAEGSVTITATDKNTGLSTQTTIYTVSTGVKTIECPFQEEIYVDTFGTNRYYQFTPDKTGYYSGTMENFAREGYDSCGFEVNYNNERMTPLNSFYDKNTVQHTFYLIAGRTYDIWMGGNYMRYGATGSFQWKASAEQVNKLSFDQEEIVLDIAQGNTTYGEVSVILEPLTAYGPIQWTCNNTSVLEMMDRYEATCGFQLKEAGRAILTATCNGKTASVSVIAREARELKENETLSLKYDTQYGERIVVFTAKENGNYVFSAENCGYISVAAERYGESWDENTRHVFTRLSAGERVVLEIWPGTDKEAGCKVTVTKAADEAHSMKLGVVNNGDRVSVHAVFTPGNAYESVANWEILTPEILGKSNNYDNSAENTISLCSLKKGEATVRATTDSGLAATITFPVGQCLEAHSYTVEAFEATCKTGGFTVYTCEICGDEKVADRTPALNHNFGDWVTVTMPTPSRAGVQKRSCTRCEVEETREIPYSGNFLDLSGTELEREESVWLDGSPYPVEQGRVELPEEIPATLVCYTYNAASGDVHSQYPTGMRVYRVIQTESGIAAQHIPELDNLLQYSGSSIRIAGNKGIRMITSIRQDTRNALTGNGLAGYRLLEYGTLLAQTGKLGDAPLVLNGANVRSNYAFKKGVADPIFKYADGLIQYTNVLVGFDDSQCAEDIAMRPYVKLMDENGQELTIYGGTVYRSIGYIAYQNRNAFPVGSGAYHYVWSIIHNVYGTRYDGDYKG